MGPEIILLSKIPGKAAYLSFIDEALPFSIKRLYWIYDTEESTGRGNHAHLNSDRIIVCLHGEATITIENTAGTVWHFLLDQPNKVLYFPRLHWVKIKLIKDSVVLAASSCSFKEDEIVDNYADYRKLFSDESINP